MHAYEAHMDTQTYKAHKHIDIHTYKHTHTNTLRTHAETQEAIEGKVWGFNNEVTMSYPYKERLITLTFTNQTILD